jgi:hypothetical protein
MEVTAKRERMPNAECVAVAVVASVWDSVGARGLRFLPTTCTELEQKSGSAPASTRAACSVTRHFQHGRVEQTLLSMVAGLVARLASRTTTQD